MIRNATLTLSLIGAVACGGSDSTGPKSKVTTTFLSYVSSPGDYIGQGESHRYDVDDGTWIVETGSDGLDRSHITVTFNGEGGLWWTLNLKARGDAPLAVGRYDNATRWPFQAPGSPGLDFSGSGRGCNMLTGNFVIYELAFNATGKVDRLLVTFEQRCEFPGAPPLNGEVAVLANPLR